MSEVVRQVRGAAPAVQRGCVPAPEDEGANPGLEFEQFLVWQGKIHLCQPGNRKSKIVDLI